MLHTVTLARLTAERRHYQDLRIGDLRLRAVRDHDGNRALWVIGRGCIRLIYSVRPKRGNFLDARIELRQLSSGRSFRVSYFFNPTLIYPLDKKPFKIPIHFISKPKASPGNREIKITWLTAQSRHYHNFLLADGHKITLNKSKVRGTSRTLQKWTPNTPVSHTIASRKKYIKHSDGKLSDMPLKGSWGWIDTYYPERYDIWDTCTRTEPNPEIKPVHTFTLDADF